MGLKSYGDIDRRHTTIMAIMAVCGGGLLACITNYRRSQTSRISTRQFRVTESMNPCKESGQICKLPNVIYDEIEIQSSLEGSILGVIIHR